MSLFTRGKRGCCYTIINYEKFKKSGFLKIKALI